MEPTPIDETLGIENDLNKHQNNIESRGFGLDFAARFFNGRTVTLGDRLHEIEHSFTVVGEVEGFPLTVTFTVPNGRRRIVSAHKASRTERNLL